MSIRLFTEAVIKFAAGLALYVLLVFLPAGTLEYRGGRLMMALLFIPMFTAGIVMMVKAPDLLASRLDAKEEEREQKSVIVLSALMFTAGFVICGLNFRFRLHIMPESVSAAASVVFLAAYAMYGEVLRENAYLSRTIQVREGQTVVDTGLYAIVRHPMYLAALLMFLAMPLILGSAYAFALFLIYPFILAKRIVNEEKLLEKELEGYREYKKKVRYRMLPFIW